MYLACLQHRLHFLCHDIVYSLYTSGSKTGECKWLKKYEQEIQLRQQCVESALKVKMLQKYNGHLRDHGFGFISGLTVLKQEPGVVSNEYGHLMYNPIKLTINLNRQLLDHSGYRAKPSLSTINRVLKRNGLIVPQSKTTKKNASGTYYPEIKARHPGQVHQLDLVTPRYIKGYGVIISVNRIDVCTGQANLEQYDSKGADSVIDFLIDDWKVSGMPRYLQVDNEAAFRGSLYHSRTFGKVSRFCLNFGVELVFIPFKEPWRNAYIESFNSRFDRLLWQSQPFTDLEHLKTEAKKFRDKHNTLSAIPETELQ